MTKLIDTLYLNSYCLFEEYENHQYNVRIKIGGRGVLYIKAGGEPHMIRNNFDNSDHEITAF
jgi:hypothetical protein